VKTYRDRARELYGVTEPEMILCVTAHAVFEKGSPLTYICTHTPAHTHTHTNTPTHTHTHTLKLTPSAAKYFGVKPVRVGFRLDTYEADVNQIRKNINRNTVVIIASAPQFPHGNPTPFLICIFHLFILFLQEW
jgi:sphinganine-1-phosphate aldolase